VVQGRDMNVLLIGPRGCGKTSVGRELAARRGLAFVDLDDLALAAFSEKTVSEVWATHGEEAWRRAEADALRAVLAAEGQVVALGGGTPMIAAARRKIEIARYDGAARVVYLRCSVGVLEERLADPGDRPSLTGVAPHEEIGRTLAEREPVYLALADVTVDGNGPAETAVRAVEASVFEGQTEPE
jgi:shikimate kinase